MTRYPNKLVRDKVPEISRAKGEMPFTRVLDDQGYTQELVRKLGEEVDEFKADLSIEELADIQEVLLALADVIASREELEAARLRKVAVCGTFKERIFLEKVEDPAT